MDFAEFVALVRADPAAGRARAEQEPALLDLRTTHVGETALHWLAIEDCAAAVVALIAAGADVDGVNGFGATALHDVARLGNREMCRLLLVHGAAVDIKDHNQATPVSKAVESRVAEVVRLLLDAVTGDINHLFCDIDAEMTLDGAYGAPLKALLGKRGLRRRYDL